MNKMVKLILSHLYLIKIKKNQFKIKFLDIDIVMNIIMKYFISHIFSSSLICQYCYNENINFMYYIRTRHCQIFYITSFLLTLFNLQILL
jgi:hypothetical protein